MIKRLSVFLLAGLFATGPLTAQAASSHGMTRHQRAETAAAGRPYSDAVRVGNILYLSGQIGEKPDYSGLVPGGMEAETRQAMNNIVNILGLHGATMADVFKCTVMIVDMSKWGDFNKVYKTFFKAGQLPARSSFGANGLALGAQIEVECWAYVPH